MKNKIFMTLAACVALAACNKQENPLASSFNQDPSDAGELCISIDSGEAAFNTKVSAYTTQSDYERSVQTVQVLVFDASGTLNVYADLGNKTTSTITTTSGTKTVWAVVNYSNSLASIKTVDELKAKTFDLSANSTDPNKGFVMSGSTTCSITKGGSASCAITVYRFLSRIAVQAIRNSLPASLGALKVERVFLSNVVGNQNLGGDAAASTWYNKDGRKDSNPRNASYIIDGTTYAATYPQLTYSSVGISVSNGGAYVPATPALFYTFPNSSTVEPNGFQETFTAKRSVVVVAATVNGTLYYYPVSLNHGALERNKTTTLDITITGLGSSDPNIPVEKGSCNVTLTVAAWADAGSYNEVI